MILTYLFILYCIMGILFVIAFAINSYVLDKKVLTSNLQVNRIYRGLYNPYSLKKRTIGYIIMGPFWIIGLIFVKLY